MAVEISPSSTRREEHGVIRGRIERVADVPASSAGLLRTHPGPVGQRIREGVVQLVPMVFDLKSGIVRDAASDARPEISV